MIDDTVLIVSHDTYPGLSIVEQAVLDFAVIKPNMPSHPSSRTIYSPASAGFSTNRG
jgi:hypothetical protein